ncbi:MAG: tetratricopeptide repeat protein [Myxococcales bacterium]
MGWFGKRGRASDAYVRDEPESLRVFYKPLTGFAEEPVPEVRKLVEALSRGAMLPADAADYPTDPTALRTAASSLESAARDLLGARLSLDDGDPSQLDLLVETHLLPTTLRPFFAKGRLRGLSEAEADTYATAREGLRIPREPLLYYALGAWWGEWLVRHCRCDWRLFAPLHPLQTFPDAITVQVTLCLHPFSQVTKKLCDPEGDNLAFKSALASESRREVPPFPLLASLADAEQAFHSRLHPRAREALELQQQKDGQGAFDAFCDAIDAGTDDPHTLVLAGMHAISGGVLDAAEDWLGRVLERYPAHRVTRHNLAVARAQAERYPEALQLLEPLVAEAPEYGRARMTLASLLMELGRAADAGEHLQWIVENDPELAGQAKAMLAEVTH